MNDEDKQAFEQHWTDHNDPITTDSAAYRHARMAWRAALAHRDKRVEALEADREWTRQQTEVHVAGLESLNRQWQTIFSHDRTRGVGCIQEEVDTPDGAASWIEHMKTTEMEHKKRIAELEAAATAYRDLARWRWKMLVKGHTLEFEGRAYDHNGRLSSQPNGNGRAKCSCGEYSPELPSSAARKRWHKEHKKLMLEVEDANR